MGNLAENFGAECFLLAFDQFTARRGFAERFCRGVIDAGLNYFPWYCISRLDTVDKDLLNLMRKAGCETMCYGIDSGSKKTLAFIRKDIDREILFDRVRETTEAGIIPTLSFVIGFPEESRQDLEETLDLALRSAATGNTNILVQMTTILPGTDLYENYRQKLVREVDTYFSLGIEFDRGKRIASDDALIDADPAVFCSFYNLPCPAATLEELNKTAMYFTIITTLYPRSFLSLSLELNRSILDLFFGFINRVAEINAGTPLKAALTPGTCLAHFSDFASECLARRDSVVRDYIPELVRYETSLLRAANAGTKPVPFHIDPYRTCDLKPVRSEKISIEQFTFDIPGLIFELKCGLFPEKCPRRDVFLSFSHASGGTTEVREINEFGFDFLRLCDGERSLEQIASQLYPKYGANKESEEFAVICAEAAGTLSKLEILTSFEPARS